MDETRSPSKAGEKRRFVLSFMAVVLSMLVVGGVSFWLFRSYVIHQAEENIANLLMSHKGIHHYVQNVLIPSYTHYQEDGEIPGTFYAPELLSSSFIVRNQHVFYNEERKDAGLPELYYKLAANNPRNPVNKADALEADLIRRFNEHRDIRSFREILEIDGRTYLYVALPFLENDARCMRCHGDRSDAPQALQARYPGQGGFNEHLGEIRAITSIRAPLEHEYANLYIVGLTMLVGLVAIGGLFFFNSRLRFMVRERTRSLKQEVEERRNAERVLSQNRLMLSQILNTAPQSIFWKDRDGVYQGCNQAFARAVGLEKPEQIVGKVDFDLPWPRAEAEAYRADDQEVMKSKRPKMHIIEPLQQADGRRLVIDTSKVPLLDEQGNVCGVLGVYEDITERQQMEDRLRQADKMSAVGQLAGGVAHDFNNQLSAIMGYADLVVDQTQEADAKRYAQGILVSAQRAADLTQQLLAFSRKGKYLSVPVAIHQLIGEVTMILGRSIDKRIHIVQLLKAEQAVVIGDPSQLQNALLNVALNARDAMPQGGTLTFETETAVLDEFPSNNTPSEIPSGPCIRISVADTGCGMTDEVKKHLFEPFFTTKKVGQGTGMGLASVYGTVRNHQGSVHIYSEVGRGTTVRIYLPLAPDTTVASNAALPELVYSKAGARILVVDDEKNVREMAADLLRSLGYRVATCADGQEAREYYRTNWAQVDLVILDMVMPGLGGRDTFIAMRQVNPQVRALLSSGYSLNGQAQEILDEGVLGFVGKPYRRAELSQRVAEALKQNVTSG